MWAYTVLTLLKTKLGYSDRKYNSQKRSPQDIKLRRCVPGSIYSFIGNSITLNDTLNGTNTNLTASLTEVFTVKIQCSALEQISVLSGNLSSDPLCFISDGWMLNPGLHQATEEANQ